MDAVKPKRPRYGGRQVGSKNKRTAEMQAACAAEGITPLAYMLRILRDETEEKERRDEMAKAAAPYIHAKLQAVEVSGKLAMSHEEQLAQLK